MSKKNIVIVGFPKSGTTWASRLIAELIECPLNGDWGYENITSLYEEGEERISQYQCYKSHHTYDEIKKVSPLKIHKIIYVIRDPRDIVISGIHYFNFTISYFPFIKLLRIKMINHFLKKVLNKLIPKKTKKKLMNEAVLHGGKDVNYWLKTPWKEHYKKYFGKEILFVKYEDLLESPEIECNQILDYLQIESTSEHIKESINKQSFQKRKQEVSNRNNSSLKKLIRNGSQGYWKKEFTDREIALFKKELKDCNPFYQL
ncbi:sulfotransferase domain-containing protein [uncultured Aquimarina sp.]|uniref:sulfotransferase domain-containing protein n=1 Tax=uncultured Aquimarina sp. TaxID=575652 RepID=UPI00261DE651|nr:sulfotransferase domain-containing protein [uncultured Aquimarina sp.]